MDQPKSVLSLDEIKRVASTMREKITAIKVSYDFKHAPTEAEKEMMGDTPDREEKRTFALRGPLRSATTKGLERGEPDYQHYVFDGKHVAYIANSDSPRVLRVDYIHMKSLVDQKQPYAQMMDIRYEDDNSMDGWDFPETLSLEHFPFHVRGFQEKVGDCWCHVVEHPADDRDGEPVEIIWVDSDNPAIMVKRVRAFSHKGSFIPMSTRWFGAFREVIQGVWLPELVEAQYCPHPTVGEMFWGVPRSNAT